MAIELLLEEKNSVLIKSDDYLYPASIFYEKYNTISIVDINKFTREKSEKAIELSKIMKDYYRNNNKEYLNNFYSRIRDIDDYKITPEIEIPKDFDVKKSTILMPVMHELIENSKKKYVPYIPGSSLKGAFRNAIRNYLFKMYSIKIESDSNKPLYIKNGVKKNFLDDLLFYQNYEKNDGVYKKMNASYDVFKFFEFTDFQPQPINDYKLKIVKLSRKKRNNEDTKIQSYAIVPYSTTFYGRIGINKSLDYIIKHGNEKNIDEILKILSDISGVEITKVNYNDMKDRVIEKMIDIVSNFYKKILDDEKLNYPAMPQSDKPILLGFGGGIEEKTIISSMDEKSYNNAKNILHSRDTKLKLNEKRLPSTMWTIEGKKFGVLNMKIK